MSAEIRRFWWLVVLALLLWAGLMTSARAATSAYRETISGNIAGQSNIVFVGNFAFRKVGYVEGSNAVRWYVTCDGYSVTAAGVKSVAPTKMTYPGGDVGNGTYVSVPASSVTFTVAPWFQYVSWGEAHAMVGLSQPTIVMDNAIPRKTSFAAPKANYDVRWTFFDDTTGKKILDTVVPAGEERAFNLTSPDGHAISYLSFVENMTTDGAGGLIASPGVNFTAASGLIPPEQMQAAGVQDVPGTTVSGDKAIVTTQSTGTTATEVISSVDEATASAGSRFVVNSRLVASPDAAATNSAVVGAANVVANAVGVTGQEIVQKLDQVKVAVGTGGGGGGGVGGTVTVDLSPVVAAQAATTTAVTNVKASVDLVRVSVDAVKVALESVDAREAARKAEEDSLRAANPSQSAMTAAGTSAGSTATGIINGAGGAAPTALGYTIPEGSGFAEIMKIEMPAAFGGATFDLNPLSRPSLLAIAHWFRSAVQWLALVTLGVWIWQQMSEWVRGFAVIRQATGNAVVGGTGAQATALLAAGLITTAVVVALTALMSWSFGDIGFAALRSAVGTNPFAGLPVEALGFLSEILPVATLVSCLVARFTFNFYGSSVFAACSAVIRFVVT